MLCMYVCVYVCLYVCLYVGMEECMYVCILIMYVMHVKYVMHVMYRPNHTEYTPSKDGLSTPRWEMSAPLVILERRSNTMFCSRRPKTIPNFC